MEIHAVEAECWSMYFRLLNHKKLPACHQKKSQCLGPWPGFSHLKAWRFWKEFHWWILRTFSIPATCGVLDMSDPQGFCWNDSEGWIMVEYCVPRLGHSCSFFYYLGATPRGWRESQKVCRIWCPCSILFLATPGFLVSWLFFCVQIFHQFKAITSCGLPLLAWFAPRRFQRCSEGGFEGRGATRNDALEPFDDVG